MLRIIKILLLTLTLACPITFAATNTLAFFVGHSQWEKGSKGTELPAEWDFCRAVGEQVVQLAPKYNLEVKVFYRGPGPYPLAVARMHQSKDQWSVSAPVISCHYNATPARFDNVQINAMQIRKLFAQGQSPKKGSLMGTLVMYKATTQSEKIANKLLSNVLAVMKRPLNSPYTNVSGIVLLEPQDRGADEVLYPKTKSPVLLLEIGYGDNPIDSATMSSPGFKSQLAEAILKSFNTETTN